MKHKCSKCGKTEDYDDNYEFASVIESGWHKIELGRMGYGSIMDGSDINFEYCDDCLYDEIMSFENPRLILCTGSNCSYEYEGDYS